MAQYRVAVIERVDSRRSIRPGECITDELLDHLRRGLTAGMHLPDPADPSLGTIRQAGTTTRSAEIPAERRTAAASAPAGADPPLTAEVASAGRLRDSPLATSGQARTEATTASARNCRYFSGVLDLRA
jgi:hypothetical protein